MSTSKSKKRFIQEHKLQIAVPKDIFTPIITIQEFKNQENILNETKNRKIFSKKDKRNTIITHGKDLPTRNSIGEARNTNG